MKKPVYLTLKAGIEEAIKGMVPNASIPSERELAQQYQVSRMTARKAVDELIKEGKLYRKDKVGTFVADGKLHEREAELIGFTAEVAAKGMTPRTRVVSYEVIKADPFLARRLEIKAGEQVHSLLRVRLGDDIPMTLEHTFIPRQVIPDIPKEVLESSLYAFFDQQLNIKIASGRQTVSAIKAQEQEAKLLQIPLYDPLLYLELTSILIDGKVLEFVKTYANPQTFNVAIHSRRKW